MGASTDARRCRWWPAPGDSIVTARKRGHADRAGDEPVPDGVSPERRADRTLFEIDDTGRERTGSQHEGEVRGFLLGAGAGDDARVFNLAVDDGHAAGLAIEQDGEFIADVGLGVPPKAATGVR